MANRVVLTGRLTADPELRHTQDNTAVTSFSIAVPRRYKKDATDFLDIVAWRKEAEFVAQYFTKGKWIEIDGSVQTRSYTDKDGNKRKAVEIVADNVGFVGDRPKEDGAAVNTNAAYPPPPTQPAAPPNFDPFANAAPPPVAPANFPGATGAYGGYPTQACMTGPAGFDDVDEDGDLRF